MNSPVIPLFKVAMSENAHEGVAKVLASGMVGEGPEVARFQQKLATLFDQKHVIPLSSCTGQFGAGAPTGWRRPRRRGDLITIYHGGDKLRDQASGRNNHLVRC